ncbi:MAG TPA: trehalose-6-phosphate synthase [Stellaceae bacterium]|nr:trehalose-6-phosphate synthase [Stellaceae bacterium]
MTPSLPARHGGQPKRDQGRLVIVSNRVPDPAKRGTQAGGLAVAVADALTPGSLWFGWSGKTARKTATHPQIEEADGITYATIDLGEQDHKRFYVGFANSTLWPLLHFRLGLIDFKREDYAGYIRVNKAYAAALAPLLQPDDIVWIHDYHLIPLAAELRALGVKNKLGFFLHVPFVPASVFAVLPPAKDLLRALCTYDVVGFQTDEHLNDFRNAVRRMLGAEIRQDGFINMVGVNCRAMVVPIGIDAQHFAQLAERATRSVERRRMETSLAGRSLVIGVDRLDYSKGLPHRFRGFAKLLANEPELRGRVHYLQIAAISREEVAEYQTLRRELDHLAGNVNGRFGEVDWTPLRYMTRAVSRTALAGLYRAARIGLVTPLRDGMNLVAKEYVAAQDPADPGVLVLSQFAGAAEEMGDAALLVNPYDSEEIAEAICQGLAMGLDERRQRFEKLVASVFTSTAENYCRQFIAALTADTESGKTIAL